MELTVIGCYAPYPPAGEACSCYLVREGESAILIDLGHGAMSRLPYYIDPALLSGVVITHFHPDHAADLEAFRHYLRALGFGSKREPLPLFMPLAGEGAGKWRAAPEFAVREAAGEAMAGVLRLEFFPARHALNASMLRVTGLGGSLFYTADTAYFEEGVEASRGSDILLAECSLMPGEEELAASLGHLTWRQCGQWGSEAGCSLLIPTHFWPLGEREEIEKEVRLTYRGRMLMAGQGLTVRDGFR